MIYIVATIVEEPAFSSYTLITPNMNMPSLRQASKHMLNQQSSSFMKSIEANSVPSIV